MSAIRERTALCIIDLPKKLISRRNLHAHFSKFGEVKELNLNKELESAVVTFTTHFDAQCAKTKGNIYDDKPLSIYWSDIKPALDPRSKKSPKGKPVLGKIESESLWDDDDKETFGVETLKTQNDLKKAIERSKIKPTSKPIGVKKRLGPATKNLDMIKTKTISVSPKSPTKVVKVGAKTLASLKKSILNQANKRKLVRKAEDKMESTSNLKSVVAEDQTFKTVPSMSERSDLKIKLDLLDERDKKIREKMIPDSNIKTAVAMRGTCPDMCPERERIMRQYSLSVAVYETVPGKYDMDENKAVKEYTRSSADQEVPLPHDLRPEPVLSMTMNYLITQIINKIDNPDENKSLWYSFCWNRLRSVRKDIILQQLCDLETVKIVEQCARFHISCYDHMLGAEVSGYDDKINTSNLVDCLQTLRHMYEDLAKHNITCPNESEFYSYLILLKMETGDIMWEYLQYSPEVQHSPEVQFAIKAYLAFKNNMYSKFFKLVSKASYLTSCLLQRYFKEVRTKALKTMQKAYGRNTVLSSSFVVSTLKFDSEINAKSFCERLEVDLKLDCKEKGHDVNISDSSFLIKEKRLPIAKAVVGESNTLPVFVPHQVSSSFDEFGQLKAYKSDETDISKFLDSSLSEEDSSGVLSSQSTTQQSSFEFYLPPKKQENVFDSKSSTFQQGNRQTNSDVCSEAQPSPFSSRNENVTSNFFSKSVESDHPSFTEEMEEDYYEVMDEEFEVQEEQDICNFSSPESKSILKSPEFQTQNPFFMQSATTNSNTSNKSILTISNVPVSLQTFSFTLSNNEKSKSGTDEKTCFGVDSNKTFHILKTSLRNSKPDEVDCKNYMQIDAEADNQPKQEVFKQQIEEVFQGHEYLLPPNHPQKDTKDLLLEKLALEKAEEEKRKMEELKKEAMERLRKEAEEQKMLQALKKDVSERLKASNARKCARKWKERVERLKIKRADLPVLIQLSVSEHLKLWGTVKSFPTSSILERVKFRRNLTAVTSKLLRLGITDSCSYLGSYLAESLARFASTSFRKGDVKPVFWKLAFSVPWVSSPSTELSVFNQLMKRWCKQSFHKGTKSQLGSVESLMTSLKIPVYISVNFSDDYQSSCSSQAIDALLFVVLSDSESEKMCLQRLRSLVTSHTGVGDFSVAVMNIGGIKFERVLKIELEELHEQNLVDHWTISTWSDSNSMLESLTFLTEHVNVTLDVCAAPLEIVVKEVCEEFFDTLSCGQHSSSELFKSVQHPNKVVSLYNTCLTKLEDLLVSSKLEKYFNFAEEFKACVPNSAIGGPQILCGRQYDEVYKTQISKKINSLKLEELPTWPPESLGHLVELLKAICDKVGDISVFGQVIRMIDPPDDTDLVKHLQKTSWLNIVELWAQCNLRHCFSSKRKSKQIVLFNKNEVKRLTKQHWWLKHPLLSQEWK